MLEVLREYPPRLLLVLQRKDIELLELQNGVICLLRAAWFFIFNPFSRFPSSYVTLEKLASETGWAFLFLALGVLKIDGLLGQKRQQRRYCALAGTLAWGTQFCGLVIYRSQWGAAAFLLAFVFFSAIVYARLSVRPAGEHETTVT